MPQPRVVRAELGTPDAIVVETSGGRVFVVADPGVSDAQLEAITLAAQHLPHQGSVIPEPRTPQHRAAVALPSRLAHDPPTIHLDDVPTLPMPAQRAG